MAQPVNIDFLVSAITETHQYFQKQAQKQVNTALTIRNWLFGLYITEYELNGADRAGYGKRVMAEIAKRGQHIKGLSESSLYLFKQFYLEYPHILQSPTGKSFMVGLQQNNIFQSLTEKLEIGEECEENKQVAVTTKALTTDPNLLLNRLSFTHIVELLKADTPLKRFFYETEAIKNNWSVRDLQRAMNSMLFERTGLSADKKAVVEKHATGEGLTLREVFRNPYMLEFLGLEEKPEYSETDLEAAIIDHLQAFLIEMGRGFCFEARQKRITFDNRHYRIDLVFYHRILKCHVLIDLKIGEFDHADAGQMNVYLNYYKENEMQAGDELPVGIILCAGKNENLVRYATGGLSQPVFVSKYMVNLPSETELRRILNEEQARLTEEK